MNKKPFHIVWYQPTTDTKTSATVYLEGVEDNRLVFMKRTFQYPFSVNINLIIEMYML